MVNLWKHARRFGWFALAMIFAPALVGAEALMTADRSYIEAGETFGLQLTIPGQQRPTGRQDAGLPHRRSLRTGPTGAPTSKQQMDPKAAEGRAQSSRNL